MSNLVYKLQNKKTLNFYVGSSKNFSRREKEHFNDLRKNEHHCTKLQDEFNLYGESSIEVIVIGGYKTLALAREVEDLIIKTFDTLNTSMSAYATVVPFTDERRENLSERNKGNKHNIDRIPSLETILKMSESRMGKTNSEKAKKLVSEASSRKIKQLTLDGVFIQDFSSVKKAGEYLGGLPQNISKCLSGAQSTAYGFKWEYVDESSHDTRIIDTSNGMIFNTLIECARFFNENVNNMRAYLKNERVNQKYPTLKYFKNQNLTLKQK